MLIVSRVNQELFVYIWKRNIHGENIPQINETNIFNNKTEWSEVKYWKDTKIVITLEELKYKLITKRSFNEVNEKSKN